MAAPKNNSFWKDRKYTGRKKKFKNPTELWNLACEYFQYVDQTPIIIYVGGTKKIKEKKNRPYLLQGLWAHIPCSHQTWQNYKALDENDPQREGFLEIIGHIENIIYEQKFSGAASGIFHHQIIARSIGLVEKVDVESGGQRIKNEWHLHGITTSKDGGFDPDGQN